MKVPMNNSLDLSSRERVRSLFHKNVELESRCKKAAHARIPSDPNAWQQIRENYEAIILEDHVFAEQHEVEYALWQLHYRRIEELRSHLNAALTTSHSAMPQGGKVSSRPERVNKIRSLFKAFLSEATGFYHDLMLKIRTKYGLPLGFFSDGTESWNIVSRDGNKSTEMKKGVISCHRCLIYLGDLSRYKGLFGEGESKTQDFAAASSYYIEAASLCPSSGNPHHQLAILASYSGDELVAIYRYFRSLAVDYPFSTARDNLIVEFEKNRQSFSHVLESAKASSDKNALVRMNGRRRGRGKGGGGMTSVKDDKMGASAVNENPSSMPEILNAFSTCFVRLNGILFTRTSLEMFIQVLSLVRVDLLKLLSSGSEEKYNFGSGASDSGLMIVRLVAVLIFTAYSANRETEDQSYAAILQCSVLLQNACTAIFEVMGLIVKRCLQLQDPLTSFLLPGVLIFMEWLACQQDIAAGSEVEEKQATARSLFWKSCVSLLNKLLTSGLMSINEDKDETRFSNMSTYNEGETENQLALWEDFELRGFLPLVPAQLILDFTRKQSFENDGGEREIRARLQRIVAAGKSLASVVQVGKQRMYFDSRVKRFAIGFEPQSGKDTDFELSSYCDMSACDGVMKIEHIGEQKLILEDSQLNSQLYAEMEEEDEVIVFKPCMTDKFVDFDDSKPSSAEDFGPGNISSQVDLESCVASVSASQNGFEVQNDLSSKAPISAATIPLHVPSLNSFHTRSSMSLAAPQDVQLLNTIDTSLRPPASLAILSQHVQPIQPSASKWPLEYENSIADGLRELNLAENGLFTKPQLQESFGVLQPATLPFPFPHAVNYSSGKAHPIQVSDTFIPSKLDSVVPLGASFNSLTSMAWTASKTKNPISRPTRHVGPPPGFSPVPPKFADESFDNGLNDNLKADDYSWLDGYQLPSSTKGSEYTNSGSPLTQSYHHLTVGSSPTGAKSFPFPGKQFPSLQAQSENHRSVQDYQVLDHLKLYQEQQMQQQLLKKVNHQSGHLPEQYWPGQLPREGRFFV